MPNFDLPPALAKDRRMVLPTVRPERIERGPSVRGITDLASGSRLHAKWRRAATLSIANTTDTSVVWDSLDMGGSFLAPASTTRFSVPVAALWRISLGVRWANNVNGSSRTAWLERSTDAGATFTEVDTFRSTAGPNGAVGANPGNYVNPTCVWSDLLSLGLGDLLRVRVYQDTGIALNLNVASFSAIYEGSP